MRRAISLAFVVVGGGFATAGSCGPSSQSAAVDAGSDSYGVIQHEAGEDRSADVVADSASVTPDAGGSTLDGSVPDFTAGWVRVPWASNCPAYEPGPDGGGSPIAPFTWVPCTTGRSGCMQLSVNWGIPLQQNAWLYSAIDSPGGGARLALGRDYSSQSWGYQAERLVVDTDTGPVYAIRHDGDLSCLELWLGDFTAGQTAATLAVFSDAGITQYREILGTPESLAAKQSPDYSFCDSDIGTGLCPTSNLMSESKGNDAVAAMYYGQTNTVGLRDRSTGHVDPLPTDAGHRSVFGAPTIVGSAAVDGDVFPREFDGVVEPARRWVSAEI